MKLRLKLMGQLKANAPEGGSLELPDGSTIADVLKALGIDPQAIQVAMVNGKPRGDQTQPLSPDDEVMILPPVGGG